MQRIFRQLPSQDGAEWACVRLGDIFKKVSRRNADGVIKNVITNSAEYGLIPQRDFFDKDIAVDGNTANYYVIENGDFALLTFASVSLRSIFVSKIEIGITEYFVAR